MSKASVRPERVGPADEVYDAAEAAKYAASTRMVAVQRALAERALELLALPAGQRALLADLGCGSGLSGEVLSAAGHWCATIAPGARRTARGRRLTRARAVGLAST